MARQEKNTVEFPEWNPHRYTKAKIFDSIDNKIAFKAFRSSSSGFINNPIVREIIFSKDNYKCVQCGSSENLQIDHIMSVLNCFKNKLIYQCNTEENLQTLCNSCNASKPHESYGK